MLIGRRFLLGAAACCVAAAPEGNAIPRDDRIRFRIMREGRDIGTHVLAFKPLPNGLDIRITVRIAVTFGPITLFRYELDGIEQWRDGQVARLAANTNDDGTHDSMQAVRDRQELWVSGNRIKRYLAPPDALPATHWNAAELRSPWINPQDGRLLHPTVTPLGPGPVQAAAGHDVTAERYDVSGDAHMQIWYTRADRWAGLIFKAHDGSLVRYEQA
ncbi:MAG TPA: DUF6134 family protein [Acetobacteraceae bacterium]|jgi:hypothetical protein